MEELRVNRLLRTGSGHLRKQKHPRSLSQQWGIFICFLSLLAWGSTSNSWRPPLSRTDFTL